MLIMHRAQTSQDCGERHIDTAALAAETGSAAVSVWLAPYKKLPIITIKIR